MEKFILEVPKGVRYMSDWVEFKDIFPMTPHIMDKTITGCGFTEWCLGNEMNTILCSPRNILLDNKAEQHPGEVYRIVSEAYDKELDVDKDISSERRIMMASKAALDDPQGVGQAKPTEADEIKAVKKIDQELGEYITNRRPRPGQGMKILVTYDSFGLLRKVLEYRGMMDMFNVVIDEWQSIFTDSRFKSSTEMSFVKALEGLQKVCYLSATPMMDKYMSLIPGFVDLPYYELDWAALDPARVIKPNLIVRCTRSIFSDAKRIIEKYLEGQGETRVVRSDSGNITQITSQEAVFYVNSVNNICDIIKKTGLSPSQVNILCAKTSKNKASIKKKLGSKYEIGRVPLQSEPRKMFTFCTRTVYLGADFYSDNAKSFIFSDANVDSLSVDISLDLPQILGRQRLLENPWKNSAEFYYKPISDKKKMTQDEFNSIIAKKLTETENLLKAWREASTPEVRASLAKKYKSDAINSNYKEDYVAIDDYGTQQQPEVNKLVMIAEQRAFDIQQIDYADRFTVVNTLYLEGKLDMNSKQAALINEVNMIQYGLDECQGTTAKLKFLCETDMSDEARKIITDGLDNDIQSYLSLGSERLKALGYHTTKIKKETGVKLFDENLLKDTIYQEFAIGESLSNADAKQKLKDIYQRLDYGKTPKATDLENWFEVENDAYRVNGKVTKIIKIVKKL